MRIISRKEAKERGLARYFTGKACKYGHVAERQVLDCICVVCSREKTARFRERYPDRVKRMVSSWEDRNRPRKRELRRESYHRHAKSILEKRKSKYRQDPELSAARLGWNKAQQRGADIPEGATLSDIIASTIPIYAEARRLTTETGIPHHVDHIVPIKHGGLHCPTNLQVLTRAENLKKGASWIDDSLEADAEHWEKVEEVMQVLGLDELAAEDWVFQNDIEDLPDDETVVGTSLPREAVADIL